MKIFIITVLIVFAAAFAQGQDSTKLNLYKKLIVGKWVAIDNKKFTLIVNDTSMIESTGSGSDTSFYDIYIDSLDNEIALKTYSSDDGAPHNASIEELTKTKFTIWYDGFGSLGVIEYKRYVIPSRKRKK